MTESLATALQSSICLSDREKEHVLPRGPLSRSSSSDSDDEVMPLARETVIRQQQHKPARPSIIAMKGKSGQAPSDGGPDMIDDDDDDDDFVVTPCRKAQSKLGRLNTSAIKREDVETRATPRPSTAGAETRITRRASCSSTNSYRSPTFGGKQNPGYVFDADADPKDVPVSVHKTHYGAGRGVFVKHVPAGHIITSYAGFEVYVIDKAAVPAADAAYLLSLEGAQGRCIEGIRHPVHGLGLGSFVNHSDSPNSEMVVQSCVSTTGPHNLRAPGAWVRARLAIGEPRATLWTEVTVSYGRGYWHRVRDDDSDDEMAPLALAEFHKNRQ
jgi:hypothetical protein